MNPKTRRSENNMIRVDEDRLGSLSHDIRGSLHALRMGIVLLRESRDNESGFLETYRLLESEERRTRDLVNELLELAGGSGLKQ